MYKNAVIISIPLVGLDRESMESHVIHVYKASLLVLARYLAADGTYEYSIAENNVLYMLDLVGLISTN